MPEFFDVWDYNNNYLGLVERSICHNSAHYIHRSVHIWIFSSNANLLLQQRGFNKKIQPGKWDSSVGGHLSPDEDFLQGAYRELEEELNIKNIPLIRLYSYLWKSTIESEMINTFLGFFDNAEFFQKEEIENIKYWRIEEIEKSLNHGIFTPCFEFEWKYFKKFMRSILFPSSLEEKIKYLRKKTKIYDFYNREFFI